jgi:hypothetical protein
MARPSSEHDSEQPVSRQLDYLFRETRFMRSKNPV